MRRLKSLDLNPNRLSIGASKPLYVAGYKSLVLLALGRYELFGSGISTNESMIKQSKHLKHLTTMTQTLHYMQEKQSINKFLYLSQRFFLHAGHLRSHAWLRA